MNNLSDRDAIPVESVREKTNTSLANERTKTDKSLAREQDVAEGSADRLLKTTRIQADEEQTLERKERDATKMEARQTSTTPDIKSERRLDDLNLELERKQSDEAQEQERAESDAAVTKERKRLKLAAEAMLSHERRTTDADLLGERNQIDNKVELADASLELEMSAHDQTKAMMAIVSHDLRNPLGAIVMGSELLQSAIVTEKIGSEKILQLLGIIRRNAASMDRLITDLLDVERMSAGKLTIQTSNEAVNGLFKECDDIFGILADGKSIKFTTQIANGPLSAKMDHDRILQVLSNLVGNALKHTASGGSISLKAVRVDDQIKISVTDTGTGIPKDEQVRIFDKFSQLKKRDRQGLGLGLHVSKWIVEAHGGTLSVESEPGRGSTFTFTVPAVD